MRIVFRDGPDNSCEEVLAATLAASRLVGRCRPERLDGIARSAWGLSAPDSRLADPFLACRVPEEGTRAVRASTARPLVYRAADVRTRDDCIRYLGRLFRRSGPARCEFARGQTTGPRPGGRLTIRPDTSELACRT